MSFHSLFSVQRKRSHCLEQSLILETSLIVRNYTNLYVYIFEESSWNQEFALQLLSIKNREHLWVWRSNHIWELWINSKGKAEEKCVYDQNKVNKHSIGFFIDDKACWVDFELVWSIHIFACIFSFIVQTRIVIFRAHWNLKIKGTSIKLFALYWLWSILWIVKATNYIGDWLQFKMEHIFNLCANFCG